MEDALNVILILLANGCRTGTAIPVDQARDWLAYAELDDDEIIHGIAEAAVKNWLRNKNGTIQITGRGVAAAQRSKH